MDDAGRGDQFIRGIAAEVELRRLERDLEVDGPDVDDRLAAASGAKQ